jgi:hypothetical protein
LLAAAEPDGAAEPESLEDADLDHPFAFAIELRFIDTHGLPVPDVRVFLAPSLCGFSLWPEASDARGEIHMGWRGRQRSMALQVAVVAHGVLQPMRHFELVADSTRQWTMVVQGKQQDAQALAKMRARTEQGLREDTWRVKLERDQRAVRQGRLQRSDDLDVLCGRSLLLFQSFHCTNCHTQSQVGVYATLARSGVMSAGLHPFTRFQGPREAKRDKVAKASPKKIVPPTATAAGPTRASQAYVVGTVLAADGRPAALVSVACLDARGGLVAQTTTSTAGSYRLGPMAPGAVTLLAGGDQEGDVRTILVVLAGDENQWHCHLIRSGVVAGHARDENGGVLREWRVEFEGLKGEWADLAMTGQDGRFAMAAVARARACVLWAPDGELRRPVVHGRVALPDATPVAFVLDAAAPTRARLRVHPSVANGAAVQVEARVLQIESGRVAPMTPTGFDDTCEIGGLCAGGYRVEVGADTLGWLCCPTVQIDGRGVWDLGSVQLPTPGRVRLRLPDGIPLSGLEHGFYRRTPDVDVLAAPRTLPDGTLQLPVGDYVLVWRAHEQRHAVALQVDAERVRDVDLRRR